MKGFNLNFFFVPFILAFFSLFLSPLHASSQKEEDANPITQRKRKTVDFNDPQESMKESLNDAPSPPKKRIKLTVKVKQEEPSQPHLTSNIANANTAITQVEDFSSLIPQNKKEDIAITPKLKAFADYVKQKIDKDEILKKIGIKSKTFPGYITRCRKLNLIKNSDTDYLNKKMVERGKNNTVVGMIKNGNSVKEIKEYSKKDINNDTFLRKYKGVISESYQSGSLNPSQTERYKTTKGVAERRGVTREKVRKYLEDNKNSAPTNTRKELVENFNKSKFRVPHRAIAKMTFIGHAEKLIKDNELSKEAVDFYLNSRDSSQPSKKLL